MLQPKIIVISLVRSQTRRRKFQHLLEKNNLLFEVLNAIDGLQMHSTPPEYHENKVIRLLGYPLSASEIACFISHRIAWARCIEINQPVLILEDDFSFEPHFKEILNSATLLINYCDILRLQGLTDCPDTVVMNHGSYRLVKNQIDPLGATAYLIKPSTASRLIKCSNSINEPLDHFLEHQKKHNLNVLAIKPYPIISHGTDSTILDRPERKPIRGIQKLMRSLFRFVDRNTSSDPWFPK
jgi:glycosyl transferase family 25